MDLLEYKKNILLSLCTPRHQRKIMKYCDTYDLSLSIISTITTSINIEKGNYIEKEINNTFINNGYSILDVKLSQEPDILLIKDNTILYGEIKANDNHDSTIKKALPERIFKIKRELQEIFPSYNIEAKLFFFNDEERKNYNYYILQSDVFETLYGEDIFNGFENKTELYNEIKNNLSTHFSIDDILNYDDIDYASLSTQEKNKLTKIPLEWWEVLSPNNILKNKIPLQLKLEFSYD